MQDNLRRQTFKYRRKTVTRERKRENDFYIKFSLLTIIFSQTRTCSVVLHIFYTILCHYNRLLLVDPSYIYARFIFEHLSTIRVLNSCHYFSSRIVWEEIESAKFLYKFVFTRVRSIMCKHTKIAFTLNNRVYSRQRSG